MATTTAPAAGSLKGRARFAAACGVLSQYVKAAATAAEVAARPAPAVVVPLPLMPGADVSSTTSQEEQEPASCASTRQSQMSIFYGGRVLVLDDVPADRAAEVLRLAASGDETPRHRAAAGGDLMMPVARKASLRRFMEKRRSRAATRASATPYSRPADHEAGDADADADAACSLTLSL